MDARSPRVGTIFSMKSTLGHILAYSLLMSVYSELAVIKEYSRFSGYASVHSTVHAILGLMVSMLLVFRTNGAYAKWWEARSLWGALIKASRNLALKVRHFVPATVEERQQMANLLAVFARTL